MPCGRWSCSVCGASKRWRLAKLAVVARPERWVTLSKSGNTPKEAYRRLTTLSQSIRRSGKAWEYLAAPERHRNGSWHLHLLQRGDYIPQGELSSRAESAGMGKVTWIQRVKGPDHVAAYLVKYMSKSDPDMPSGTRRFSTSRKFWPGGRKACEIEAFGESDASWSAVLLGSSEITSEDGTKLWLGSSPG